MIFLLKIILLHHRIYLIRKISCNDSPIALSGSNSIDGEGYSWRPWARFIRDSGLYQTSE